jgi:hypothetical protein
LLDGVGQILSNKCRRASFAMYAMGLLSEGERKGAEPIAARACGAPAKVDAVHTRLLHFVKDSVWSDHDVRRFAAQYGVESDVFPPRPPGRWPTTRSSSRPERHFADSSITVRLAIARVLATWLPRCPLCHHQQNRRSCARRGER